MNPGPRPMMHGHRHLTDAKGHLHAADLEVLRQLLRRWSAGALLEAVLRPYMEG